MRPTPTTTFLFTDIAGSTRLWAEHRDAMSAALARHDALLRGVVAEQGGTVFKTVGDAVCAAFPAPLGALAAALAGQRALAAEDWSAFAPDLPPLTVRMAIHTGVAEPRDGDWFGQPLNRVARLLAIGHGGQVLVSRATEELVADQMPPEVALRDLGEHRLKDLARPERVFQVVAPDLPTDFPALRSLDALLNNLPAQLTSFVGREADLSRLGDLLEAHRLVTLTGPGGSGKTRLAVQAAAEAVDRFPDGVWFVDLAPLNAPELVPAAMAAALGVVEEAGREVLASMLEHLRTRRLLIVLDNCEHVIAAAARLASEVLGAAPRAYLLATSREALAVQGEQVWSVQPLAVPQLTMAPKGPSELEHLVRFAAVRLYVDRATAVRPDFAVSLTNAAAIAGICHRLDGIPLAIELAAARVRHMSPELILARLDDRFRLLTTGTRTALPRQQTLAATIDWSHELLDEPERAVFRRLAVFRGGWTAEAAERVCAGGGVDEWDVLDLLSRLVDKSLVQANETVDGGCRYGMLDTIRHYSRERMVASEEYPSSARRHAEWLRDLAEEAERYRPTADSGQWLDRLAAEMDNIRAALDRTLSGTVPADVGFALAANLFWLWNARGSRREAQGWLAVLITRHGDSVTPERRARVEYCAASIAMFDGAPGQAEALLAAARLRAEAAGDVRLQAWCWNDSALQCVQREDWQGASDSLARALFLKEQLGDLWDIGRTLMLLGGVVGMMGDLAGGERTTARAVDVLRQAGDLGPLSNALANLSEYEAARGEAELARRDSDEAVRIAEGLGEPPAVWLCRSMTSMAALYRADVAAARRDLRTSLRLLTPAEEWHFAVNSTLPACIWLAGAAGRPDVAAVLGGADGRHRHHDYQWLQPTWNRIQAALAESRSVLGAEAYEQAFAQGAAMSLDEACAFCLAWLEAGEEQVCNA